MMPLAQMNSPVGSVVIIPVVGAVLKAKIEFLIAVGLNFGSKAIPEPIHSHGAGRGVPVIKGIVQKNGIGARIFEKTVIVDLYGISGTGRGWVPGNALILETPDFQIGLPALLQEISHKIIQF